MTPIESFHQFYRYSYIWHFPDGSARVGALPDPTVISHLIR